MPEDPWSLGFLELNELDMLKTKLCFDEEDQAYLPVDDDDCEVLDKAYSSR